MHFPLLLDQNGVEQALGTLVGDLRDNLGWQPYVHTEQVDLTPPGADPGHTTVIGVWSGQPFGSDKQIEAVLKGEALFSFDRRFDDGQPLEVLIRADFLREIAGAFANRHRRLNDDANPDPHGHLVLQHLDLQLAAPSTLMFLAHGTYDLLVPPPGWDATYTLALGIDHGGITMTGTSALHTNADAYAKVGAVLATLGVAMEPVGAPIALLGGAVLVEYALLRANQPDSLPFPAVLTGLTSLARTVLEPGRIKAVTTFLGVDVDDAGVHLHAHFISDAPRKPWARISSVADEDVITLAAEFADLWGNVAYAWSTSAGTLDNPSAASPVLELPRQGDAPTRTATVTLELVDDDGMSAHAQHDVTVHYRGSVDR